MRWLVCFLLGCCLSGCTLEDEYAEKIELKNDAEVLNMMGVTPDNEHGYRFMLACHKCIRGDLSSVDKLAETYMQSFKDPKFKPRFFYQLSPYAEMYEKCIEKAAAEGKVSLVDRNYMILGLLPTLYISRELYAEGNLVDAASWLRRGLSIEGRRQGLETAGNIFIRKDKTYDIGIKLLGEAAQLGSMSARSTLLMLVSTNPALRKAEEDFRKSTGADSDNQEKSPSSATEQ
ncbi:MAG: hypothetical protein K6F05_03045 [Succinivibrio sp.]|nr:hypothetical protein [Succinivibrio sp.]